MEIVLLHLSDIHIKSVDDTIITRANEIASAAYEYLSTSDALFILITGDIAYSGNVEQYQIAEMFIEDIKKNIENERNLPIHIMLTPGNHDCNFTDSGSVRDPVIATMLQDGEDGIDDERIDICLGVQREYLDFQKRVESPHLIGSDKLCRQQLVEIEGKKVLIDCLNVAWISQIHEAQGRLLFPVKKYESLPSIDSDLRIVMFHHPLNWYSQSMYHHFRRAIRNSSDFIITGHEHVAGAGEIDDAFSQPVVYIEGAALQSENDSGFNIVSVNLHTNEYARQSYCWSEGEYIREKITSKWASYRKLPEKWVKGTDINKEFLRYLDDPGANFSHPAKQTILLSDIYIYPDLENDDSKDEKQVVSSTQLFDIESLKEGVIIKGSEKSGKTSLIKMLFRRFHESGIISLMISAERIKKTTDHQINKYLESIITTQYSDEFFDKWKKLSKDKKVLFIDDLDRCPIKDLHRYKILEYFNKIFSRVILTTDSTLDIEEVVSKKAAEVLSDYSHYEIKPFGYRLRGELISRWVSIGEPQYIGSSELIEKIDSTEKILDSVIGNNLVPRVPFYVLTLLQSLETSYTTDLRSSGMGYYYQYLITQSLGKSAARVEELEELFNYCSQLAWLLYSDSKRELELSDFREFNAVYSKEYVFVDLSDRLDLLCRAKILLKQGGFYSFCYPYNYYYFLGKYLSDNLSDNQEVKEVVKHLCTHLYVRDHANSILFLVHHSKDQFIIESIIGSIKAVFENESSISLENDCDAINNLVNSTSSLVFSGSDPVSYRKENRELKDSVEDEDIYSDPDMTQEMVGELDQSAKINMLFKTVEILGQILKSYYGTLRNEKKKEIMIEIYEAPLRALHQFIGMIDNNHDALLIDVESAIEDMNKNKGKEENRKCAQNLIFDMISAITFGFLFKASTSVGSTDLFDVAREIVKDNNSISYQLIEIGTLLDSPRLISAKKLSLLSRETKSNVLAHRVLEVIVLRHLYLFKTTQTEKQQICEAIGIPIITQQILDKNTDKERLLLES